MPRAPYPWPKPRRGDNTHAPNKRQRAVSAD